jgi:succinyl-diaminopimelate desuccinylase
VTVIDPVALTQELVRLDTVNPPGNEARCIELLAGILETHGFTLRRHELAPGRPNLVARLPGPGPALALTGHLDTVPLGERPWSVDPFGGELDGDRLYGRGSADMKAGVAALVAAAVATARRPGRRRGLELALTACEEIGLAGAAALAATGGILGEVGALLVAEPTANTVRLGHRGLLWAELRFTGRTAHAALAEEGDNAVLKACRAALALAAWDFDGVAHPALGRPSLNVGRIGGGLNLNSVPDRAVLGLDVRLVPGQDPAAVLAAIARLAPAATAEGLVTVPGLWTDAAEPWVQEVVARRAALLGDGPAPSPIAFCTDASFLTPAYGGVPTVILGPGEPEQAHQTDEWCSVTRLRAATELYGALCADWCGAAG